MVCHAVSKGRVGGGPLNDSEEQEVLYVFILSELLFSMLFILTNQTWTDNVGNWQHLAGPFTPK